MLPKHVHQGRKAVEFVEEEGVKEVGHGGDDKVGDEGKDA
jgi:hypothetical protein